MEEEGYGYLHEQDQRVMSRLRKVRNLCKLEFYRK